MQCGASMNIGCGVHCMVLIEVNHRGSEVEGIGIPKATKDIMDGTLLAKVYLNEGRKKGAYMIG